VDEEVVVAVAVLVVASPTQQVLGQSSIQPLVSLAKVHVNEGIMH
jgi:hypothetical protein